jgi:NAD-dependent dihydropyrimidine dehydrogenase PreA subunit
MSKNWYPILNYEQCTACGACLRKCSHGVYQDKDGMIVVVNPEGCVEGCHGCQKLCPSGAISYFGENDPKVKPSKCGCKIARGDERK